MRYTKKELDKIIKKAVRKYCCCYTPPGPYTDDAAAATAGVEVGEVYYQDDGHLVVRLV